MLNRREAFGGLAVAAAALTGLTPTVALAQAGATWTPVALTPAQARALDAAAEAIMPATDTPGAREAGVAKTIDGWVKIYCDKADQAAIRGVLDLLDAEAKAAGASSFAQAAPAQQAAVLGKLNAETGRTPFQVLKDYVTTAFFTSRTGATRTLRYDPNPGPYRGCVPFGQIGRGWATS